MQATGKGTTGIARLVLLGNIAAVHGNEIPRDFQGIFRAFVLGTLWV